MIIILSTFGVFTLLTVIAGFEITEVIRRDADETMSGVADNKAEKLGLHFSEIERAVESISRYVEKSAEPGRLKKAPLSMNLYLNDVRERCEDAAIQARAETVYFRLDPKVYGRREGIFLVTNGPGNYIGLTPTDILAYDPSDREYVGWYYEPLENGGPLWMEPYMNRNINIRMVSYVMPVYAGGSFLGIVGMDVNLDTISSVLKEVDYADGFAFLMSESGNLIFHPDFPEGLKISESDPELTELMEQMKQERGKENGRMLYTWEGEEYFLATAELENGMAVGVSAARSEILKPRTRLWGEMLAAFFAALGAAILLVWRVTEKIVKPIRSLTDAAARISKGELNTPIDYQAGDEIGRLADSVRKMARELQEYIGFIHAQAYTDAMTGVGNKAAYMDQMKLLDRKVHEGLARFAVAVFDINGLKKVNDEYGHEYGDMLIQDTAVILKKVYGTEMVYRIGGDEFIAVLNNRGEEDMERFRERFQEELKGFNEKEHPYQTPLAVSSGFSVFREGIDTEFKEVFQHADEAMYRDKERFYQGRNDRRRR